MRKVKLSKAADLTLHGNVVLGMFAQVLQL
jgi:hypothetical protein